MAEAQPLIRKIVVAVDSSTRAQGVVETAIDLGSRYQAEIVLIRVIAIPQDFPAAAANPADTLVFALENQARDELTKLAAGRPGVSVLAPIVFAGQPWRAIVDAAQSLSADLIVIGSHGYRGWDRILGTTASKVADHADRNVLVVHERR